jgi:glucokinase
MITLGTGVGGGIIVNGEMVPGAHGASGELGHICIDPDDPIACNCGNHGCLEQKTSATGIVRLAREELARTGEPSMLQMDSLSSKAVFDAYAKGDKVATVVVKRMAEYMGHAMSSIAAVLDPEKFVIGGGVSKAGDPLIQAITQSFQKYAFPSCREIEIVLARLGNDAGIYGAAKMIIE